MEQFLLQLDSHLSSLANLNKPSFILTDSNINLASLNHIQNSNDYLNNIISNGFIPINSKSSRVQGNTHSFIDHILTNITNSSNLTVGTIISDISDHFFNFVAYKTPSTSRSHNSKTLRDINITNTENFRNLLRNLSWNNIFNSNDVNTSLDYFWGDFKTLFDISFPIKTIRFNRNIHKINKFMSNGLLISRNTKNRLHKLSILNPAPQNISSYKTYRNLYNTLIRCSKFEQNLELQAKNPKKTWDLLKEAIKTKQASNKIETISVNGQSISDKTLIAEEFNNFFTTAGSKTSDTVNPTSLDPSDFVPPNPNPP
jgi:hypothetical protein